MFVTGRGIFTNLLANRKNTDTEGIDVERRTGSLAVVAVVFLDLRGDVELSFGMDTSCPSFKSTLRGEKEALGMSEYEGRGSAH